jgi:DNA-binding MarR family transcriptional regulator
MSPALQAHLRLLARLPVRTHTLQDEPLAKEYWRHPTKPDRRLGKNQKLMVKLIAKRPGMGAKAITAAMGMLEQTVCTALMRLADRGLIERRGTPGGGRRGDHFTYWPVKP